MIILNGNETQHLSPTAVTIGFFDGVHLGHQALLRQLREAARPQGLKTAVVTFPVHPRRALGAGYVPRLLTTLEEKRDALGVAGVDYCIELPFTPKVAALSAAEFMRRYLKERYSARLLMLGYDHRFGHDRNAALEAYAEAGRALGIEVERGRPYLTPEGLHVSSTLIRGLLDQGDVEAAAHCLGRNYTLGGQVASGRQLGRRLGFPTANLVPDSPDKLIPLAGVYAIRAHLGEAIYDGMLNIGRRPTIDDDDHLSIEAHLFDFNGDLYYRHMELEFIYRMRDEHKFPSLESLREQLSRDANMARHHCKEKK